MKLISIHATHSLHVACSSVNSIPNLNKKDALKEDAFLSTRSGT